MSETKPNRPDLIAYTVTRQGDEEDGFFRPIGAAWANKKGGFGIRLHALPLNGEIVLLPPSQQQDEPTAT